MSHKSLKSAILSYFENKKNQEISESDVIINPTKKENSFLNYYSKNIEVEKSENKQVPSSLNIVEEHTKEPSENTKNAKSYLPIEMVNVLEKLNKRIDSISINPSNSSENNHIKNYQNSKTNNITKKKTNITNNSNKKSITNFSSLSVPSIINNTKNTKPINLTTNLETVKEEKESVTPVTKPETPKESVTPVTKPETPKESITPVTKLETVRESVTPVTKLETVRESVTPVTNLETVRESVTPATKLETVREQINNALINNTKTKKNISSDKTDISFINKTTTPDSIVSKILNHYITTKLNDNKSSVNTNHQFNSIAQLPKVIPAFAGGGYLDSPKLIMAGDSTSPSGRKEGEFIVPESQVKKVPRISSTQIPQVEIGKNQTTPTSIAATSMGQNASLKLNDAVGANEAPPSNINVTNQNIGGGGGESNGGGRGSGTSKGVQMMKSQTAFPVWRRGTG